MEDLAARLTHQYESIRTDSLAYIGRGRTTLITKVDLVRGKKAIIGNPDSSATVSTSHGNG